MNGSDVVVDLTPIPILRNQLIDIFRRYYSVEKEDDDLAQIVPVLSGVQHDDNSIVTDAIRSHASRCVRLLVIGACFKIARWLVENWGVDVHVEYNGADGIVDLIHLAVSSPENYYCKKPDEQGYVLGETDFYLDTYGWDGTVDIVSYYEGLDKQSYECEEYGKFLSVAINGDEHYDARLEGLIWLMNECGFALPHAYFFVQHSKSRLLDWAASIPNGIDLQAPMDKYLAIQCRTYPWLGDVAGEGSSTHLTVGEVLCALAAGLGEFGAVKMLLEKHIRRPQFTVSGGRNLLHIAAERDKLIIVKWLLASKNWPVYELTVDGKTACQLAILSGKVWVARYMIQHYPGGADRDGMSDLWYVSRSQESRLLGMVEDAMRKIEQTYIVDFIQEKAPSWFLMRFIKYSGFEPLRLSFDYTSIESNWNCINHCVGYVQKVRLRKRKSLLLSSNESGNEILDKGASKGIQEKSQEFKDTDIGKTNYSKNSSYDSEDLKFTPMEGFVNLVLQQYMKSHNESQESAIENIEFKLDILPDEIKVVACAIKYGRLDFLDWFFYDNFDDFRKHMLSFDGLFSDLTKYAGFVGRDDIAAYLSSLFERIKQNI